MSRSKFTYFNLSQSLRPHQTGAIIDDYDYWNLNETRIKQWIDQNGCSQFGTIIYFPSEHVKTMFALTFEGS